jgi:hypothetical protein
LWRRQWTELVGHRPGPPPGRAAPAGLMMHGRCRLVLSRCVCVCVSRFGHVRCRVSWLQCHDVFSGTDLLTAHIAAVCCVLNLYRSWIFFFICLCMRSPSYPATEPSTVVMDSRVRRACMLLTIHQLVRVRRAWSVYKALSLSLSLSLSYISCSMRPLANRSYQKRRGTWSLLLILGGWEYHATRARSGPLRSASTLPRALAISLGLAVCCHWPRPAPAVCLP